MRDTTHLMVAVREVQPGHIHAFLYHCLQLIGCPARWSDRAYDLIHENDDTNAELECVAIPWTCEWPDRLQQAPFRG